MKFDTRNAIIRRSALLAPLLATALPAAAQDKDDTVFRRIATFPVFKNNSVNAETSAEIVAATENGKTLVYTNSPQREIGFVDISKPAKPAPGGTFGLTGAPTSVAVTGSFALAAVVTDESFTAPKGALEIIHIGKRERVATIELNGQPDSIAISPDKKYAVVVMENQRDEELGDGAPGQPGNPPGSLIIVDMNGKNPAKWTTREVSLLGLAKLFPNDPEPEFVDINSENIAAVTLQENNHIVLVDLKNGKITNHFSAGSVKLRGVDTVEDDVISQNGRTGKLKREPDSIAWLDNRTVGIANEGDFQGGSRGFTIFDKQGNITFDSGNGDDQLMAQIGHYPESRSENKGNEPEAFEFGVFGKQRMVFIGSERSSIVSAYKLDAKNQPELVQVLPAGLGPEGVLAIPERNLLVVASENDSRADGIRGTITIYQKNFATPSYPKIVSADRKSGKPIPWSALSALAADNDSTTRLWTVEDNYYKKSRILGMDISAKPAVIDREIRITDPDNVFLAAAEQAAERYNNRRFVKIDPAELRNEDGTLNIDAEGLCKSADGGFWIASEGSGTVFSAIEEGEASELVTSLNWLIKTDAKGAVTRVVSLPKATNKRQRRFGFEGVAATGPAGSETLYVCFQREWGTDAESATKQPGADPEGMARIGKFDTTTGKWTFFHYPLDEVKSPNGGWVGLSEIVALGDDKFAVLERDNQAGTDARIKRIYSISLAGLTGGTEPALGETPKFPRLQKKLVKNLLPVMRSTKGPVLEKTEGLAILPNKRAFVVTDNDGVDDSTGETQFFRIGKISAE